MLIPQAIVQSGGGAGNFTLISDSVLGSSGTFDFTSIPGTYKHLKLVCSLRLNAAVTEDVTTLRINSDSGANYNWQYKYWTNVTDSGGRVTADTAFRFGEAAGGSATAGQLGSFEILFPDYAGTVLFKTMSAHGGRLGSNNMVQMNFGHWLSTAAITRITLVETYATGSRATLYGLS